MGLRAVGGLPLGAPGLGTPAAVAAFVGSEAGQALFENLKLYDAKAENYMEHFYREIYTSYDGSNHSLNPNFVLAVDPALNTAPKRAGLGASAPNPRLHGPAQGPRPGSCLVVRGPVWFQLVAKKSAPQTQARAISPPIGTP